MNFHEAVPEGFGKHLPASIRGARRVLCGEEHEVRMRGDGFLELGNKQLAIVVKKPIEGLGVSPRHKT